MTDFLSDLATSVNDPNAGREKELELIPVGNYRVVINKANDEPYVDGAYKEAERLEAVTNGVSPGRRLAVEFEIIDGTYAGRKVWERLTFEASSNQRDVGKMNPAAYVEWQQRMIKGLFKRARVPEAAIRAEGFASLVGRTLMLDIGIRAGKNGKKYQSTRLEIGRDEVIDDSAPPPAALGGSSRPVVSDESPF